MKTLKFTTFALSALATTLCLSATQVVEKTYSLPKCEKPVASVLVGKLTCKSAGCQPPAAAAANTQMGMLLALANAQNQTPNLSVVGDGMVAILTTVLKETGCFDIQEREAMEELAKELALVGKKMEIQQADFMISGAITSISMESQKSSLGGGFIPIIGAISTTKKSAEIALDIKIIDINRAKVFDAKTFQANNETSSTSFGAVGFGPGGIIGGGMSSIKDTPMEPIVRDILTQIASFTATRMVAAKTPGIAPAPAPAPEPATTHR